MAEILTILSKFGRRDGEWKRVTKTFSLTWPESLYVHPVLSPERSRREVEREWIPRPLSKHGEWYLAACGLPAMGRHMGGCV